MKKNKVIQKIFKLFLVCLMFLGALFQNSNLSFADGAGVDRAKTKITKLEIKKVNGESLPDNFTYDYWEKYRLDMDWDASEYGNQLKAGDHFTVTLPREFNFPKDSAAVDFPLYAPDGRTVIANAHVDSNGEAGGGTVKVTFTDYVENKDNIRGNMFLQAGFARDNVNAGGSNLITVDIGGVKTSKNIKIGTKGTVGKETLAKWGEKVENDESAVKWFLRINHKKGNFKNVTISDSLFVNSGNLPPEIHYIEDSFVLYEIEFDESGSTKQILRTYDYAEIKDFITLSDNNTKFTFDFGKKFGDTAGKQYLFRYMSTYIPQLVLRNEAVFHSAEENTSKQASYKSAQSGGGGQGDLIQKIKIFKVDENNNKIKLPNAEFLITKVKDGSTFTLTTDAQGEAVSEKLEPGKYKIKETRAPKGYSLDGTEKEVTVAEGEPLFWTVKNAKEKVNIEGTKTWKDENNQDGKRPDKIKVILNKTVDGVTTKVAEKEVTKDNWSYEFNNLPKYENGKEIAYSIDEEAVAGYEKEVTGYNLKNSHTPEVVNIQGTKTWDDANNQDGKRPDKIKVILNKTVDGVTTKVTEKEVTKDNWNYEFNNLPKYKNGKEIAYSIDEEAVAGYEKEVTGYNLKNSHTPEVVNIQGTKTWDDANNQDGKRPDKIKVILNKTVDGVTTKVTEKEVTKDNWNYEFNNLPKYKNGKEIAYSIDEEAVAGYEKEVTGYNLKNSHTPEVVNIQGTKTWDDANNQDGKRPDKIKVILNKTVDGVTTKVTEKEVTKDNWNYEFNNLPKYKNGKEIAYSIDEEAVAGYEKEVTGYNLKNSHTPEVVNIQGTKTWDDANNQDGKRPDKIKVILNKIVDGVTTKVAEKEVTKDNWNYEFNNLPKYKNGKKITYSIDEEAVPGYEKEVTGYNLKNSHTPEVVNIQGTKTWDDANNQDGKRPDKIKVILNKIVDGVTTKVAEKEVTKDNWNYEFNNLPKYKNGKKITYSIDEEAVPGYEKEVTGYNLKNSHTPEVVNVQGTKTWDDANNKYGKRPEKITVILNKTVDGKTSKIIEATVTKDDNWSYSFKNLPKYENGKLITYSIDEEAVAGYKKTIDGYNLKNTYIPPKPKLPNTGSTSTELGGLGFLAALTGLVLARRKNKTN